MRFRIRILSVITAIILVFLASFSPVAAQGEEPTSLKNVIVSVYPEYDDPLQLGYPTVLVMFDGEVVTDTLPTTIRFLVPSGAAMYSAGSGPRDQYQGGPPNRKSSNITGWDEISYELTTNYFVVEYYVPILGQPDKATSYVFRSLYPISNLTAIIQEPKRATNFTVTPQSIIRSTSDGFQIHTYNYTDIAPDTPLHFDISYTKADAKPSLGSSSGTGLSNVAVILIILGVIVVLVGGFFLIPKLKTAPQPAGTRAERRRAVRTSRHGGTKSKFCSNCGRPVQGNDRFCPNCGNQLD